MMCSFLFSSLAVVCVDIAFGATMAAAGIALGRWLFRKYAEHDPAEAQRIQTALTRVRDLASSVAHNVGQHNSRVHKISSDLHQAKSSSTGEGFDQVVVDTVAQMIEANERLQSQLAHAEGRLQEQAREIQEHAADARTDQLTGINNRRALDDELARRHAEWKRHDTPYTIAMIDVDHFKEFNDTHGHQAGDFVLKGVAQVLKESCREMDVACRYGGEEFSIIMPATQIDSGRAGAERARQAIEAACFLFEGTELRVTASLGLAEILAGESNELLIKRADEALYAAKEAGRNRSYYHDGAASHPLVADPTAHEPAAMAENETAESEPAATATPPKEDSAENPTPTLARLPDQQGFNNELRRRIAEAKRFEVPLSLMMVDVDNFKRLRAKYGEEFGHLVLDMVAQYLEVLLREMDLLARFQNGQFSVMLPGSSHEQAVLVAQRLRKALSDCTIPLADSQLRLSVSMGIAQVSAGDDTDTLIKRADAALFASKAAGYNSAHLHDGQSCQPLPDAVEEVAV